jgi:hypothetical protein
LFEPEVQAILGKPVNHLTDTASYFGFLVSKNNAVIFKTFDKTKAKSKKDMRGAECSNTSNLPEKRIQDIQTLLKNTGAPIVSMLLNDDPSKKDNKRKKERQDAFKKYMTKTDVPFESDFEYISDLSKDQGCPYMEFLLRYADRHSLDGTRWFLSLVDSERAGF